MLGAGTAFFYESVNADDLFGGEEECAFDGGVLGGVGAVDDVLALAVGIELADGSLVSLCRIGRADQRTEVRDGVLFFEDHRYARAGGHEIDQLAVKGALLVHGVKCACGLFGEAGFLHRHDAETGAFDLVGYSADELLAHAIGLEDGKGTFHGGGLHFVLKSLPAKIRKKIRISVNRRASPQPSRGVDAGEQLLHRLVGDRQKVAVGEQHRARFVDQHVGSLRHAEEAECVVGFGGGALLVAQEQEGEFVLFGELLVRFRAVAADADDLDSPAGEGGDVVAVVAELRGADRRIVAGVKDQKHFLALELRQGDHLALAVGKRELGCDFALFDHGRKPLFIDKTTI